MLKDQISARNFGKVPAGQRKKYLMTQIAFLTGLIAFVALFFLSGCSGSNKDGYSVEPVNYKNKTIQMTNVESFTENGGINISISDIAKNSIIYTEYNSGNLTIPLMAYVAPSGRLVAAVSICEPCRSSRFFIEDNVLVCSACFTKWELDGMKPISGGCLNHPPDEQEYKIEGDYLVLSESVISSWKPRSF